MSQTAPMPDLSGKTALVTGASRGIGRAMARALAQAGAHIIAVARTQGGLEELDDEIRADGGSASLVPMDLSEGDGVEQLVSALADRYPAIDILLANAAILGELAPLTDIDPVVWRKTLDLNVTVNWRLLRALDPMLRAAPAGRAVFLTSSVGGLYPRAFWGGYAVSKAALEMLAKTYAEEIKTTNIKVAIIDPGAMRTAMRAAAVPGEDPQDLPAPEALAPLLYHTVSPAYEGVAERFSFKTWNSEER
ncbi:MAG: SDR family NAD(P)-dependent oxidoreductase [Pseudomonadota bacterium]